MSKKEKRIAKQTWIEARTLMYMETESLLRNAAQVKAKFDYNNQ